MRRREFIALIRKESEMWYPASELQRYLAWSPALLGGVVALLGLILAGGGAYLAWLGEASITFWSARCLSRRAIFSSKEGSRESTPTSARSLSPAFGPFGRLACRVGN